jgi:hypothetical protein
MVVLSHSRLIPEQYFDQTKIDPSKFFQIHHSSIALQFNGIQDVPEGKSTLWEVTVSVILSKKVYMYMCVLFRTVSELFHVNACIKERQNALMRATRHVLTRVAKCIDVDGGIFENIILSKLYQLYHLNNKYWY